MSLIAVINDNVHTGTLLNHLNAAGYRANLLKPEWYAKKGVLYFDPENRERPVTHSTIPQLQAKEERGEVSARYYLVRDIAAISERLPKGSLTNRRGAVSAN